MITKNPLSPVFWMELKLNRTFGTSVHIVRGRTGTLRKVILTSQDKNGEEVHTSLDILYNSVAETLRPALNELMAKNKPMARAANAAKEKIQAVMPEGFEFKYAGPSAGVSKHLFSLAQADISLVTGGRVQRSIYCRSESLEEAASDFLRELEDLKKAMAEEPDNYNIGLIPLKQKKQLIELMSPDNGDHLRCEMDNGIIRMHLHGVQKVDAPFSRPPFPDISAEYSIAVSASTWEEVVNRLAQRRMTVRTKLNIQSHAAKDQRSINPEQDYVPVMVSEPTGVPIAGVTVDFLRAGEPLKALTPIEANHLIQLGKRRGPPIT